MDVPDENVGEENTPQQNTITDVTGDSTHAGTSDADIFVFTADNGDDTITGFANGVDHIDLSAFPEIRSFDDLTVTSDTTGVTIDLSDHGGGTIFLQGFSVDDLDGEDFIFASWEYGTGSNDRLLGDATAENIDALGGDDTVFGGGGGDSIRGGEGRDSLLGDAGGDTIFGDAGNDWISSGSSSAQTMTRYMAARAPTHSTVGSGTTRSRAAPMRTPSISTAPSEPTRSPTSPTGRTPLTSRRSRALPASGI